MHINVEYPDVVIDIREIKACVDAGDKQLKEKTYYQLRNEEVTFAKNN